MPLAIELAAARIKLFDPATMTERLAELPFVAGTRAVRRDGRPDRHATLKRAVDWSFALLEPSEQALFVRLSVFAGGFRIEAVEAVAAGSGAGDIGPPLYALSSLVDQSMVLPAVRGPTARRASGCCGRSASTRSSAPRSTAWGRRRGGRSPATCATWCARRGKG
ncbi:MAG: hypothetical protein U0470_06995 [Anaerolineae bacterium]